jgi:hypothetical protein
MGILCNAFGTSGTSSTSGASGYDTSGTSSTSGASGYLERIQVKVEICWNMP